MQMHVSPGFDCLDTTPVVLVVGDFRASDTFAWGAWKRIRSAYCEAGSGPSLLLTEPTQTVGSDPSLLIQGLRAARRPSAKLFPIALSDLGDMTHDDVHHLLLRHLCTLNVVSIIACGTARNTRCLLNYLASLTIPVVVIVDSTVQEGFLGARNSCSYESYLRLVPSGYRRSQSDVGSTASRYSAAEMTSTFLI
jgi:hypothetical protein